MTILAWLAVTITVGTWVGIRLAEENQRMHNLIELVTPMPDDEVEP